MNCLITIKFKDNWYSLSNEERGEITGKTVTFHEKYLKEGKLKDTYTFVGAKIMIIWDVESIVELMKIMINHPYRFYADFDNEPFIDHQEVMQIIQERGGTS